MLLAEHRGEILIGYRFIEDEYSVKENFGVKINIPKHEIISPREGDCMIVLSEDEL